MTQFEKAKAALESYIGESRNAGINILPPEDELATIAGVGRNTLRRVISVLQDDGIVRRIQGKGTFIEEAPVTISFYNWLVYQNADTNPRLLMDRWFREFQSESGVNVDNVAVNYSLYSHALHDALLDAVQPDLVLITPFWFHSFQRMKLFRNLDDYLGRPVFADVYNPALEMMKNRDRIYGVPWVLAPLALYYNKNVLAQAGLNPEKAPQTLDELASMCRKVEENGQASGICFSLTQYAFNFFQIYPILLSFGGGFSDPLGNLTIDSEANLKALHWLQNLYKNSRRPVVTDLDTGRKLFANDKLAFLIDGPYARGNFHYFNNRGRSLRESYGVAKIPVGETGRSESILLSHNLAIPRNAPHPDEAFRLIEYLLSNETRLREYHEIDGVPPAVSNILYSEYYARDPFTSVFIEQLETASTAPFKHPLFVRSLPFLTNIFHRIIMDGNDAAAGLAKLREIIEIIGLDSSETYL